MYGAGSLAHLDFFGHGRRDRGCQGTWQSRPLDTLYPIVYLDCIHVKIRDSGVALLCFQLHHRLEIVGIEPQMPVEFIQQLQLRL